MPSWTWINEDVERSEEEIERVTPFLDRIAQQISNMRQEDEHKHWARQSDIENGYDIGPEYEDEADRYADEQMERVRAQQREAEEDALHAALEAHGARLMRPYEHWNEDERCMSYMENRFE